MKNWRDNYVMKLSWNASQPDKSLPPSLSGAQASPSVVSPLAQWNHPQTTATTLYTIHSNRESTASGPMELDLRQDQRENTQEEKLGIFDLEIADEK